MTVQWCVFDLDGTLLNSQYRISRENIAAINRLQAEGIQFLLATGRPDFWVKEIVDLLQVQGPLIACNGAVIRNVPAGNLLRYEAMDASMVQSFADYCLSRQIDLLAYTTDTVYYTPNSQLLRIFLDYNRSAPTHYHVPVIQLEKGITWPAKDVVKLLGDSRELPLDPEFQELLQDSRITAVSSRPGLLDIMARDISKGNALSLLAESGVIDLSQTVVFGDNYNDLSMFSVAGYGVAMGNAETALKEAARFITRSNEDHGVAYAIDQWILKGIE